MIKKILYITIFCTAIWSQTSSLGLSGFGERMESFDASSIALGDGQFFSGNSSFVSFSSISTYWRSSLTRLCMTLQVSNNDLLSSSNLESNGDLVENHFQMFSFMFPVGENKVFSFGMNPMYRSDIVLTEQSLNFIGADNSPTGEPLAFRTTYDFSGGVSEFFTVFSMKASKHVSLGLRWSKLFGNSYYRYVLSLSDVSFTENETIEYEQNQVSFGNYKQKYSSDSYNLEIRFQKKNYEFVSSYFKTKSLKINFTPEYDLIGWIDGTDYFINNGEERYGLGFKYIINDYSGLTAEYHEMRTFDSFDFLNILDDKSPNIVSKHLGYYHSRNIRGSNRLDQVNLRFGLYSKEYQLLNSNLTDNGITLGFGIEYLNYKNSIDIALKIGNRNTEYSLIDYESYYKLVLSITSGEKWFEKRRDDI